MNKNEKNSIRKHDSIASDYDSTFDGRFTVRYKQKVFELCDVPDVGRVLDVGRGNGSLINAIRNKGKIEALISLLTTAHKHLGFLDGISKYAPNIKVIEKCIYKGETSCS